MGDAVRQARARAQLLHRPGGASPAGVVAQLLAVQAQDLRAARLAIRARAPGLVAADVGPGLVRTWLCRGTLHLVTPDDWPWLHALTAPPRFTANTRRLTQLGFPEPAADRAVAAILTALAEGPLPRDEIAHTLTEKGVRPLSAAEGPSKGSDPWVPHLVMRAALRGLVVMEGDRFVRVEPPGPVDRDAALRELARRYLRGHGPATAADLAAWAGLPLRDARAGLAGLTLVEHGNLVDLPGREPPEKLGPRLLPAFDPYLLGWKDRSFAVPPALARRVHPGGGIIRATATVDGLAVGTWSARGLDVPDPALFDDECADVARFLGTPAHPCQSG